ncbi:MAG: WG repeat-containing protein [Blastocatellia bacterium]
MSTPTSTSTSTSTSVTFATSYEIQVRKELAKEHNFRYVGIPTSKNTVRVLDKKGNWKLIDLDGKPLTKNVVYLTAFSEGRAKVQETLDAYHQYFIDETGDRIDSTSLQICRDSYFSEGLASARDKTNRKGYINKQGQLAIACLFQQVTEFSDSVAWVRYPLPSPMGNLFYLIDKTGNKVLEQPFLGVNNFVNGVAGVQIPKLNFNGKRSSLETYGCYYVIIDKNGNQLSQNKFPYIEEFVGDVAIAYGQDNRQIFINKYGEQTSKNSYEGLGVISDGICSLPLVDQNKAYYIDTKENQISDVYDEVNPFSEGVGCVKNKGQYFFIDRNGKEVFSEYFDKANSFDEGVALVQKGQQVFYIDHTGEKVF